MQKKKVESELGRAFGAVLGDTLKNFTDLGVQDSGQITSCWVWDRQPDHGVRLRQCAALSEGQLLVRIRERR